MNFIKLLKSILNKLLTQYTKQDFLAFAVIACTSYVVTYVSGGLIYEWYTGYIAFDSLLDSHSITKEIADSIPVPKETADLIPDVLEKDLTEEQRKQYESKKSTIIGLAVIAAMLFTIALIEALG